EIGDLRDRRLVRPLVPIVLDLGDQQVAGALVKLGARLRRVGAERGDGPRQNGVVVRHRNSPFKGRQRIGGAYWMPPLFQRLLMPRGMASLDPVPTFRSNTSP